MHKNICFVELEKDENGFYKAVQTCETACIRAFLKENGINSMIYSDETLPSISDMSEDILSLSDDVLCFIVHVECKEFVQALIKNILELEDVEIVAISDVLQMEGIEIVRNDNDLGDNLLKIIDDEVESTINILSVSPYESEIILARDASKYGVWLGRDSSENREIEAIIKDIQKIKDAYSGLIDFEEQDIQFNGKFIDDKKVFNDIANDGIKKNDNNCFKFMVPVTEDIFDDIYAFVIETSNIRIILKIQSVFDEEKTLKLIELVKRKKVSGIYFPAELLAEKSTFISTILSFKQGKLLEVFPYGEVEKEKVSAEILSLILDNTRSKYLPFFRGLLKSRTGIYTDVKLDGYVHHVEVSEQAYKNMEKDFINDILSVNSSVCIKDKKCNIDDGKLYFDRFGIAHNNHNDYSKHINSFSQLGINPSNYIVEDEQNRISINSLAYKTASQIVEIEYKDAWKNIKEMKKSKENKLFIFKLTDEEDFQQFIKDAELYKDSHELADIPIVYGYLENGCRFISPGQCSVDKVPRIKIDAEGNIHICDMGVKPIAKMGTSLFELNHKCFVEKEKQFQKYGCYDCPMGSWCSKCTQMPDFMRESYCSIMKHKPYVLDYVLAPYLYFRVIDLNRNFEGLQPNEVKVSNEYMFNIISDEFKGETAPYLPKFTSLILCRNKYLFWSVKTNKFYNVSYEFACIIELLLKRVEAANIAELLAQTLHINMEESNKTTKYILNTLKKSGALYRDVE